jgi:hypothetical protein
MEFEDLNNRYNTEYTNRLLQHRHIFYEIYQACGYKFWKGCGSYLFDGQNYQYQEATYPKQELLYNSVKNVSTVLEIGTYMGHSLLIMLLANPNLKITCIDISEEYTLPSVTVLNKYFNNAITFIKNDSISFLQSTDQTFDFFHVDGHHENEYIRNEFNLIKTKNNRSDNILQIIFDDQDCLVPLQQDILNNYNVINRYAPGCLWSNVLFEIQL